MSEVLRVDAEKLQAAVAAIMEKEGVAPQDAAIVADSLVSAELTGLQSHGVQRVKFYTDSMEAGGTDPRCRIKTIRDFPGGALLDAQGALGIVAAYRAMELAIQKAKDVGIGIVNVRNSNHCSCTAYYIRMAAKENMLAIVSSNAPKSMAPWGSREKYLGTNPLAVGAPTHGDPVMIDMATSVVARGKIILADKKGDSIPEGWAIDVDGHPTTDAAKALEGCVLPFGGAKGSGIAMMIDVFSGVLSGAAYGSHIHNPFAHPEVPMDTGHCMIAIDISRFQDPEEFKTTMDTYRSEVKGLKPAAGVEEIFMPGEIECNNYRKNLEAGPQLSLAVYRELEGLCEKLHIPFDILKKKAEETTMLMLQVRYTLQEGKDPAAFVRALEQADIPARTRAETGCCQYEFFYSASSPNEVLLLEAWADEIAQQAHKGTAQCAELQKVKAQYVADVSFRQYTAE